MKKGYTLIELIILLVILSIIGIIIIPIVLHNIDDSRYEEAKAKAYITLDNIKSYYIKELQKNDGLFEEKNFICTDTCVDKEEEIEMISKPDSGNIKIAQDGTITGEIVYFNNDYTFYICNDELFDEKIEDCFPKNSLYVDSKDYSSGDILNYAGLKWYVISDNGEDVTLVLNNIIGVSSLGEKEYNYENSILNTSLNIWFNNNPTLVKAKEQNKLVLMNFSDSINNYESYIRIPTKKETGIYRVLDTCNKKWCNIKNAYWLLTIENSKEGIYKAWSIGDDNEAYSIDITNEIGIRPVITVKEQ